MLYWLLISYGVYWLYLHLQPLQIGMGLGDVQVDVKLARQLLDWESFYGMFFSHLPHEPYLIRITTGSSGSFHRPCQFMA